MQSHGDATGTASLLRKNQGLRLKALIQLPALTVLRLTAQGYGQRYNYVKNYVVTVAIMRRVLINKGLNQMAKLTKVIAETWPNLVSWPASVGFKMPTADNVAHAATLAKTGTKTHAALTAYMVGASNSEAALFAQACHPASLLGNFRVKRDQYVKAGILTITEGAQRDGHTVFTVALAKLGKVTKAKVTKAKVTKPEAPETEAPEAPEAA